MATIENSYVGNGSTVLYSFTFPYISTADVKVSLNGVDTTSYTFSNATTIQMATAPASGVAVRIYRLTSNDDLESTFYPGSAIRAQDLNNNFIQGLYVSQESGAKATTATTIANTALSNSTSATSTANTALANSTSAVSTANTASTNASAAVATSNTASSNASTALSNSSSAITTANTAASNASTALSTANTASSNASTALATANTASTNATAAVSTANTANTNASSAVSTAGTASSNASTALSTANTANSKADQAITAVSNSINYTLVANVAGIPASPANDTYVEVGNSTGIESFTPLAGKPAGFVGDSGLSVRMRYTTAGATWNWQNYYPNNAETRYLKLTGGTLTGNITLAGAPTTGLQPATKTYVDAADATLTTAAAAAQTTANAALPLAGGTVTGTITAASFIPSSSTAPTNGVFLPSANTVGISTNSVEQLQINSVGQVLLNGLGTAAAPAFSWMGDPNTGIYRPGADQLAISTNGTGRLFVDASGRVGVGVASPVDALHVIGAARVGDGTNFVGLSASSSGAALEVAAGSANLLFKTGGTERARIDSSGRFGLGTTGPSTLLHAAGTVRVGANDTSDAILEIGAGATGNRTAYLDFTGDTTYSDYGLRIQRLNTGANALSVIEHRGTGSLLLNAADAGSVAFNVNGSERARIDSSGRLLVGTSSGTGKFTLSGNAVGVPVALTDAATVAVDLSLSNNYTLTLAGNRTLGAPTNQTAGQSGLIVITQDATGSRTLAYNSVWKFPGGTAPTLTTTASAVDVLAFYVESSTRITARLVSDVK